MTTGVCFPVFHWMWNGSSSTGPQNSLDGDPVIPVAKARFQRVRSDGKTSLQICFPTVWLWIWIFRNQDGSFSFKPPFFSFPLYLQTCCFQACAICGSLYLCVLSALHKFTIIQLISIKLAKAEIFNLHSYKILEKPLPRQRRNTINNSTTGMGIGQVHSLLDVKCPTQQKAWEKQLLQCWCSLSY